VQDQIFSEFDRLKKGVIKKEDIKIVLEKLYDKSKVEPPTVSSGSGGGRKGAKVTKKFIF
jgi:hypothetical protein